MVKIALRKRMARAEWRVSAAGIPSRCRQASARVILQQTGHKTTAMLRRYIREGSLFRENAAAAVGLYVLLLEATARKSGGWLYHVR